MKIIKKILAMILAMDLMIGILPINILEISASSEEQNEEYMETEEQTPSETEEGFDGFTSDGKSETEDESGITSSDNADFFSEGSTENTDSLSGQNSDENGFFSEEDGSAEIEESNTDPQVSETALGTTLDLNKFTNYDANTNTITIDREKEDFARLLILLSNCAPNQIQKLNIIIKYSGDADVTETNKIPANYDISSFYKGDSVQSVTDDTEEVADKASQDFSDESSSEISEEDVVPENIEDAIEEITTDLGGSETAPDGGNEENTAVNSDSTSEVQDTVSEENSVEAQSAVLTSQEYTFQGIGTVDVPFEGTIKGQINSLKIDHTFFGGLSSKATVSLGNADAPLVLEWCGDGAQPMIAGVYQFDSNANDSGVHSLPVTVRFGDKMISMGSLIGIVQASSGFENESLNIGNSIVTYGSKKVVLSSAAGNSGIICNILKSGNICLDGYAFPSIGYSVASTAKYNSGDALAAGNAGGVVGVMCENTALTVKQSITVPDNIEITSANGNAGGLVGLMGKGTQIITAAGVTLTMTGPIVKGGISAGGIAGTATNATFTGDSVAWGVKSPVAAGSTSQANAGGFIGHYILEGTTDSTMEDSFPSCISLAGPHAAAKGRSGNAGGYFGYLEISGQGLVTYTIAGTDKDKKQTIDSTHDSDSAKGNAYGAVAGKITSDNIASTVSIKNVTITSFYENEVTYHGGLVGELGTAGIKGKSVYLDAENVDITVTNPYGDDREVGFGGLVGCLRQGSILKAYGEVKVVTAGTDPCIWQGGGVIGRAEAGSVLELSGLTDLSDAKYAGNRSNVGWLVGYQNNALIYARGDGIGSGWTYKRGSDTKRNKDYVNDIANYGQIIRLNTQEDISENGSHLTSALITIEDKHIIKLKEPSSSWKGIITLSSADDFALLSIMWNSRGTFCADPKIGAWTGLGNKTIEVSADIDLTGSGIGGLSRDTYSDDASDVFSGTFNGNGHKITLAIGETYGYKKDVKASENQAGCGIVYATGNYHAAQGLFVKTNKATIQNLIIDGKINFSNADFSIKAGGIAAGGIAAYSLSPNNNPTVLSQVTVQESIYAECAGTNLMAAGGMYGIGASGSLELKTDNNRVNYAAPKITLKNVANRGSYAHAGGVLGEINAGFKLAVNGLTVGNGETESEKQSFITTDANDYAYVSGLVGVVQGSGSVNHWMEIRRLVFDGFKIEANSATEACGGLFGGLWADVGVYFMGENDDKDGEYTNTKLIVKNSVINAPNTSGVGGLAYRSSGIWEIRDKGIDIQGLEIHAKSDVGLLVCHGESGKASINGSDIPFGALYLNTTKYWENSYLLATDNNISVSQGGIFDEFVAYTATSANEITANGKNGVISLATASSGNERVGVEEDIFNCTTYKNRTVYGQSHQTNGCSRYYYDLDQCLSDVNSSGNGNNKKVDTQQELLLWSVYRYANDNIKNYFAKKSDNVQFGDISNTGTVIGTDMSSTELNLDMRKYSYYPINLNSEVTIQNAKITFYNQEIESAETTVGTKKTQGSETDHSQHYTMHCGLFLSQTAGDTTVSVEQVSFAGSIGKVNNSSSGMLFSGTVSGSVDNTSQHIAAVSLKNVTLDGLKVNNCGDDYAPLLINSMKSYSTLDVDTVETVNYTLGTAVASSLFGNIGSIDSKQMSLSFRNILLPDKKAGGNDGIFSHATLLESFVHDGSSSVATYNFYMGDEWKNGTYAHEVTYGKEITDSTEYDGMQLWYYDEENYGTDSNRVHTDSNNLTGFSSSSYLPYVCKGYSENDKSHEIKVNQRVADITHGCGTYGHPYKITTEREMTILSEYMATGKPSQDWRVTITGNQSVQHTGDTDYDYTEDKTYQFDGIRWVQVKNDKTDGKDNWQKVLDSNNNEITLDKDFMRQYLLNAYYDLQGTEVTQGTETVHQLNLTNFGGFGIATNPFRGVLTSTTNTTVVLSGPSTSNGLIPYSYGSVVKNLTVSYKLSEGKGKELSYDGTNSFVYYPSVSFGGVIGCVLGGDNIIDNVTVNIDAGWLTISGAKKHLIQVGGYVGSVSGGGVIFRNILAGTGLDTGKVGGITESNAYASMYVNPYVGRVLDGFAFYENTSANNSGLASLENTDKNYKINTLETTNTGCVTYSNSAVTVKNAQGLLILSAAINSGATSAGNNNAYSTTSNTSYRTSDKKTTYTFAGSYGKIRNAAYSNIGEGVSGNEATSVNNDELKVPGSSNLPYLIQKYCSANGSVFNLSESSGKSIVLNNGTYDMTIYGSGYQGLTARYASSAILSGASPNAKGIVPELASFNGNDNTIILNMQVNEYVDDDYHAASVGGVFNLLRVGKSGCSVSNLTINGNSKGFVSLRYYTSGGAETSADENILYKNSVGVGGFAGATSSISAGNDKDFSASAKFAGISIQNLNIYGPQNAGGLLGSAKKTVRTNKNIAATGIALLLEPDSKAASIGSQIENSSYKNISVTAPTAAGGFVGYIDNDAESSLVNTDTTEMIVGQASQIGTTENAPTYAGGAFGYIKASLYVNSGTGTSGSYKNMKLQKVEAIATQYAGGYIGKIEGTSNINQAIYEGQGDSLLKDIFVKSSKYYAGGILGHSSGNCTISKCQIIQARIESADNSNEIVSYGAGGIIGKTEGNNMSSTITECTVQQVSIISGKAGGIAGSTSSDLTVQGCMVQGSDAAVYEISGQQTAGGIIGFSTASGKKISIKQCKVKKMKMTSSSWGCGGLLGDVDWNAGLDTLFVFDCAIESSEVHGKTNAATAGGMVGDIRGKMIASNLLLNNVKIHSNLSNKVGMIIGLVDTKTVNIEVAGISIQGASAYYGNKETQSLSQLYGVADNNQSVANRIKENSYFAFSDYSGSSLNSTTVGKNSDLLVANTSLDIADPYVVTSPKSSISVYENNNATAESKYLYGDGASWTKADGEGATTYTVKAEEIWNNRSKDTDGHYAYRNLSGISKFDFKSAISTYNANQTTKAKTDFPVLQITGGDTDNVVNYLDILTNGGFSDANALNTASTQRVTVTADVYEHKVDGQGNDKFVKNENEKAALEVKEDSKKQISFSTTTDYDNEKDRFTLLTVTFTELEADGKTAHNYRVLVPILVRRMLEIDFTATLTYGTDFRSEDYSELDSHVLESFGSSITGYLTYTYNSAEGKYTDYGWESYINAGGNVADSMEKSVRFTMNTPAALPKGTQLTLVEGSTKRAYYYTADGSEKNDGKGINVPMSSFTDSSEEKYQAPSIGELMNVTATSGDNNIFVKVDETGKPEESPKDDVTYSKPTVKIKNDKGEYEYYRLADSKLGEKGAYTIKIDESGLKDDTTSKIKETYYLVITVPEGDGSTWNGSIQTAMTSKIPYQLHYRTLKDNREDSHGNTASTYVISSGYQQTLEEVNVTAISKKVSAADSVMKVDVRDSVIFPNDQVYNDSDELYLRFVGGLQKTVDSRPSTEQFPSGTTGKAYFYIYKENEKSRTYYQYKSGTWSEIGTEEVAAVSYTWTSTGGNMELPLSTDGTIRNAISLQAVRKLVQGNQNTGTSKFYVEVRMDASIPASGLDVIPEAKMSGTSNQPDDYTKLLYSSQLSTESQSITYSTNRSIVPQTKTAYYREEPAGAKLTYDADQIGQLGINLLDLQYLDESKTHSLIDTTAVYDLSAMKNLDEALKNSSGIKFTLSLLPKNTESNFEDYQAADENANAYLDVKLNSKESGTVEYEKGVWSWIVPQSSYWDNNNVKKSSVFDGSLLTQLIRLKVNISNVQSDRHYYSNYKVVLSAEILNEGDSTITDTRQTDNIIYTLARIKPEFVLPKNNTVN